MRATAAPGCAGAHPALFERQGTGVDSSLAQAEVEVRGRGSPSQMGHLSVVEIRLETSRLPCRVRGWLT